jgi:glyoxalase family protein
VGSAGALDFWADRLGSEGVSVARDDGGAVRFADPEGLEHELVVADVPDAPLRARSTEVPGEHALLGFHAVHAGVAQLPKSARVLTDVLGATAVDEASFELRGDARGNAIHFTAGAARGFGGAGTIHHIAWAAPYDEHAEWRERVAAAGLQITPVIDRHYFRSVYFREPGGILYELASIGPGFTVDEPQDSLGERLALPPDFEAMRGQVEPLLTPLPDVRQWRPAPATRT